MVVSSATFVMGIGVTVPGVIARVSSLGSEARGTANAVCGAAVFLGASLGPVLADVLVPRSFTALTLTLSGILAAPNCVRRRERLSGRADRWGVRRSAKCWRMPHLFQRPEEQDSAPDDPGGSL